MLWFYNKTSAHVTCVRSGARRDDDRLYLLKLGKHLKNITQESQDSSLGNRTIGSSDMVAAEIFLFPSAGSDEQEAENTSGRRWKRDTSS